MILYMFECMYVLTSVAMMRAPITFKEMKRRFELSSGSLWFLERDSARLEVAAQVPSSCLDIAEVCSKSILILFCISRTCK